MRLKGYIAASDTLGEMFRLSPIFWVILLTHLSFRSFAAEVSTLDAGINFYGEDSGKSLLGATGYFLHFGASQKSGAVRPMIGAQLEYGKGTWAVNGVDTTGYVLSGNIEGAVNVFAFNTSVISPFIGAKVIGGWAYARTGSQSSDASLGITYGGAVSGGALIRFGRSKKAMGVKIETGYRILMGNLSGISGFQLNALMLSLGLVF